MQFFRREQLLYNNAVKHFYQIFRFKKKKQKETEYFNEPEIYIET